MFDVKGTHIARNLAFCLHSERNLLYDDQPYSAHLQHVNVIAYKFLYLLPQETWDDVLKACWMHDTLEDCAVTYNDIKANIGERAADIVYDVTDELGKNRKERHDRTYPKIRANELAIFVKLCDRIANTEYSKNKGSSMYDIYVKEFTSFVNYLYRGIPNETFQPMWQELQNLTGIYIK